MRLTIITSDGAVYKDDVCYSNLKWIGSPPDVHALQWFENHGWIEYNNGLPNENIDSLPSWTMNAISAWEQADYNQKHPPAPPPPTAEQNKNLASSKLFATDWVNQPDVMDTSVDPHLLNRDEFLEYRAQIRSIALNPVAGDIDWPEVPESVWSSY